MKWTFLILFSLAGSAFSEQCSQAELVKKLKQQEQESISIAGENSDFEQRVEALLAIYKESRENFLFPVVALHGALAAQNQMEKKDKILNSLDKLSLLKRSKILKEFSLISSELKRINKLVFIDVHKTYHFILKNKDCPLPKIRKLLDPEVVQIIVSSLKAEEMTSEEKMFGFKTLLLHEQKTIVEPTIKELKKKLKYLKLYRTFILTPRIRFDYFPSRTSFKFKNFFDTEERIYWAMRAAQMALKVPSSTLIDI